MVIFLIYIYRADRSKATMPRISAKKMTLCEFDQYIVEANIRAKACTEITLRQVRKGEVGRRQRAEGKREGSGRAPVP